MCVCACVRERVRMDVCGRVYGGGGCARTRASMSVYFCTSTRTGLLKASTHDRVTQNKDRLSTTDIPVIASLTVA